MRVNPPTRPYLYSTKKTHHSTRFVHAPRQKHVLNSSVVSNASTTHPHLTDKHFWGNCWKDFSLPTGGQNLIEKFCRDLNLDLPTINLIKLILSNSELAASQIELLLNSREKLIQAKELAVQTKLSDQRVQTLARKGEEVLLEGQYSVNALLVELLEITCRCRLAIPSNIATEGLKESHIASLKSIAPLRVFPEFYGAMYKLDKHIERKESTGNLLVSEEKIIELEALQAVRRIFRESFANVQIHSIYQAFYRQIYGSFTESLFSQEVFQDPKFQAELLEKGIVLGSDAEKIISRLQNYKLEDVPTPLKLDYRVARQVFLLVCFQNEAPSSFGSTTAPPMLPAPLGLIELIRKLQTIDVSRINIEVINEIKNSLKEMKITEITLPAASHLNQALYYATLAKCNFLLSLHAQSNPSQLLEETREYLENFEMLKTGKLPYPGSIKSAEEFIKLIIRQWGIAPVIDLHNPAFAQMTSAFRNLEVSTSQTSSPKKVTIPPQLVAKEAKTYHHRTEVTELFNRFRTLRSKPFQLMKRDIALLLHTDTPTDGEVKGSYEKTWVLAVKNDLPKLIEEYDRQEHERQFHMWYAEQMINEGNESQLDESFRNWYTAWLMSEESQSSNISEEQKAEIALQKWNYGFERHLNKWKLSSKWLDSDTLAALRSLDTSEETIDKIAYLKWRNKLGVIELMLLKCHKETLAMANTPFVHVGQGLAENRIRQIAKEFGLRVVIDRSSGSVSTITFFVKPTNETIVLTPRKILINQEAL